MNCLADTDVLVDYLRGQAWTRDLIWSSGARLYCASITRKELLGKPGLSASERERIRRLLARVRVLNVDDAIAAAAYELMAKYSSMYPLRAPDALVAATAWVKRLPLLTRNRKHYDFIAEITLAEFPK